MAHTLATDPAWFGNRVKVIDVGLRPIHANAFKGLWTEAGREVNPGDGTEQVLRRAATLIWDGIEENSPLLRVIFREPAFPDLADELWSAITENAYRGFASGLRVVVDAGMMRIDDPDATAAVLVASLAYYPMVRLLNGHTPGDIDRDRYLEAWISHARAGLDYVR